MRTSSWVKVDTRWYLGVHCRKCGVPILFAVDYGGEVHAAPAGKLLLTCAHQECRHQADYSTAAISRFQKPTGAK